jgi:endonuclease G
VTQAGTARDSFLLDTLFDSVSVERWVAPSRGRPLPDRFYYACYADSWRIPHWVIYYATRQRLGGRLNRSDDFRPNPALPAGLRVRPDDYRRAGFDRGHLAPAADFAFDRDALSATFLMSNMSPQYPAMNRGMWRQVEDQARTMVRSQGQGWVITGNTWMATDSSAVEPTEWLRRDGHKWIAVPSHLFKAVLVRDSAGRLGMYGYLVPNQAAQIAGTVADHLVTVRRLEQITGWDFFPLLPDPLEDSLETRRPESPGR